MTDAERAALLDATQGRDKSEAVVYPLLCKLVLQLTAAYQGAVDCSADQNVISSVLFWLICVVRKSTVTSVCMNEQVFS